MRNLDEKLNRVYEFVESYITENGFPPSVREISSQLGIKSTATVYSYLNRLEAMGKIEKTGLKKRALSLTEKPLTVKRIPLVGTVTAGQPILAVENLEGYYPLLPDFPGADEDYFMLRVSGDSMIEAGIFDGDKIIVKKQNTADNGEIVVALIEESATVKRFFKRDHKIILHPENSALSDIVLDDVMILGTVEGLVRKF